MAATIPKTTQFSASWIDSDRFASKPIGSVRFSKKFREDKQRLHVVVSDRVLQQRPTMKSNGQRLVFCSHKNSPAPVSESGTVAVAYDEDLILKNKSQEIESYLSGRCIYLVGMMGSGKTTVGKVLSEVLGYSFRDCDTLIEDSVEGTSVAEIFKLYGESYFRDKETKALQRLSVMRRLVVSTGGGAVIRPINWKYMNRGISVWLDVPLETLAQRIAAVGTDSRPLLHEESGDAFTKAFKRLSTLFEERGEAYANANARVRLEDIAAKLGCRDVSNLSPTAIAIEALEQIENFLQGEGEKPAMAI